MHDEQWHDGHLLRLEDVTAEDLPVNVRGFDRHAVERRLARVADSYSLLLRQRDELRERLELAEAQVAAAEGEARVSAREVAALTHRSAAADDAVTAARRRVGELERALAEARRLPPEGRPQQQTMPEATAAELLLAARRAAEQVRASARQDARVALHKARARAEAISREADLQRRSLEQATARVAALAAQAERERQAAEEARARREEAEREAGHVLERARTEAERAFAVLGEQRRRVQSMLGQALEALGGDDHSADVLDDLASRLRPEERGTVEQ